MVKLVLSKEDDTIIEEDKIDTSVDEDELILINLRIWIVFLRRKKEELCDDLKEKLLFIKGLEMGKFFFIKVTS